MGYNGALVVLSQHVFVVPFGIDDTRDSLSFKCRRLLQYEGAEVLCTDEYVAAADFVSLEKASSCPVIIIACPHKAYESLRFRADQHVVDCWGVQPRPGLKLRSR